MHIAHTTARGTVGVLDPEGRAGILPRLGPTAYLLLVELDAHADAGRTHVDDRTLAEALGVPPLKVREAAKRAAKFGYLAWVGEMHGEACYLLPCGFEPERPPRPRYATI